MEHSATIQVVSFNWSTRKNDWSHQISPFCLMEPNMLLKNRQYAANSPERLTSERGFRPLYHEDTVNHCPGCGKTHWHIGRTTAECAFCDTALPLALTSSRPVEPMFWFRGSGTAMATA
jgi:hypothetical protein